MLRLLLPVVRLLAPRENPWERVIDCATLNRANSHAGRIMPANVQNAGRTTGWVGKENPRRATLGRRVKGNIPDALD